MTLKVLRINEVGYIYKTSGQSRFTRGFQCGLSCYKPTTPLAKYPQRGRERVRNTEAKKVCKLAEILHARLKRSNGDDDDGNDGPTKWPNDLAMGSDIIGGTGSANRLSGRLHARHRHSGLDEADEGKLNRKINK